MDIEAIREFCLSRPGTSESFPFDDETLVFKVGGKIFAFAALEKIPRIIIVKTQPEWSEELRESYSEITGAYHMNKKHWNSLEYENLPEDLTKKLLDNSYQLVFNGLSRKIQAEILTSSDSEP